MQVPELAFTPTVPGLVAHTVETFDQEDFIVTADDRCSFAEAGSLSAVLAKAMVEAGAGKATRIGLLLPSGVAFAVTWLAAARIGALSMVLSTTYRPAELRRALRIADVQFLVAPALLLGRDMNLMLEEAVPGLAAQERDRIRVEELPYLRSIWIVGGSDRPWATPVDLGRPGERVGGGPIAVAGKDGPLGGSVSDELLAAMESEVSAADPMTVIYTSGSSADPKGVVHTQGVAVRKVAPSVGLGLQASQPGRCFCAMPFFWVGGPQMILGALHSGAAVVCQERFEVSGAVDLVRRERCTSLAGWASLLEKIRLADAASGEGAGEGGSTSLLPAEAPPGFVSSRGDTRNLGMTETFGPHADPEYFEYKVVDHETQAPVPDGQEGEFCVRGFGLMAGLYKREREEVFDADGFYHTGDRGYLESGHIYFTGRYSEMIKTGGANVAPAEVERVLLGLPGVAEAYVFGIDDAERGEAVVAVVVAEPGRRLGPQDLRARTRELLSSYKVPARIDVVPATAVPLLGSGKPDKRALRSRFLPA